MNMKNTGNIFLLLEKISCCLLVRKLNERIKRTEVSASNSLKLMLNY